MAESCSVVSRARRRWYAVAPILVAAALVAALVVALPGARASADEGEPLPQAELVTPQGGADWTPGQHVALSTHGSDASNAPGYPAGVVRVEWWLYSDVTLGDSANFADQYPGNGENKLFLGESDQPVLGTRVDGTWQTQFVVPTSGTITVTRDGEAPGGLPQPRTYALPTGVYSVQSHVQNAWWDAHLPGASGTPAKTDSVEITIDAGAPGSGPPEGPAPTEPPAESPSDPPSPVDPPPASSPPATSPVTSRLGVATSVHVPYGRRVSLAVRLTASSRGGNRTVTATFAANGVTDRRVLTLLPTRRGAWAGALSVAARPGTWTFAFAGSSGTPTESPSSGRTSVVTSPATTSIAGWPSAATGSLGGHVARVVHVNPGARAVLLERRIGHHWAKVGKPLHLNHKNGVRLVLPATATVVCWRLVVPGSDAAAPAVSRTLRVHGF